jgi:hypothetical protein
MASGGAKAVVIAAAVCFVLLAMNNMELAAAAGTECDTCMQSCKTSCNESCKSKCQSAPSSGECDHCRAFFADCGMECYIRKCQRTPACKDAQSA